METRDEIERATKLGSQLQQAIIDAAAADPALDHTAAVRALAIPVAHQVAQLDDATITLHHVDRALQVVNFYTLRALELMYPDRVTPEVREYTAQVERQLSGESTPSH